MHHANVPVEFCRSDWSRMHDLRTLSCLKTISNLGVDRSGICSRETMASSSTHPASSQDTAESRSGSIAELQTLKAAKQAAVASALAGLAGVPESADPGADPHLPACLTNLQDMQVILNSSFFSVFFFSKTPYREFRKKKTNTRYDRISRVSCPASPEDRGQICLSL